MTSKYTPTITQLKTDALRLILAGFVIIATTMGGASQAQAQDIDWLINIDDNGLDPVPAGGIIDLEVEVANNGFDPAPATTVQFEVPAIATLEDIVYVAGGLSNCSPVPATAGQLVVCDVPPLASLGTAAMTVQLGTPTSGFFNFVVTVNDPDGVDISNTNNVEPEPTTIGSGSDLQIELVPLLTTAPAGSFVDFNWVVTNNGPDTATSYQVDFPIPAGMINFATPSGCTRSSNVFTCATSTSLADGASRTFPFRGQVGVGDGSTVTAQASVTNIIPGDAVLDNNSASDDFDITAGTDLTVDISRAPGGTLFVGVDEVTWTVASSYSGDSPNDISIDIPIAANYNVTSVGGPGWACAPTPPITANTITCTRPAGVGPGPNQDLPDISIVADILTPGTVVTTATIAAVSPGETVLSNNTDSDSGITLEEPFADLTVFKTGPDPALAVVGQDYDFVLRAQNRGSAEFVGTLVLTDTIPAGMTVNSVNQNGFTCTPTTGSGSFDIVCEREFTAGSPLNNGASAPAVTINVTADIADTLTNTVTVSSINPLFSDPDPSNDTDTYDIVAEDPVDSADISVIKTALLPSLPVGEIQTFDLEVVNSGPAISNNVELTDALSGLQNNSAGPTGAGYVIESISEGIVDPADISCSDSAGGSGVRNLSCTIIELPICTAGSNCPVVTVQVRPGGNAGSRTNTAMAESLATPDPNLGNDTISAGFSVTPRADVTVSINDTPDPVAAGQELRYVVAAQNLNNGLSQAENVTTTFIIPDGMIFVSAPGLCGTTPAAGSLTGPGNNEVICNFGTINNGSQRTGTIIVRPTFDLIGATFNASASVTTSTTEIDLTNNDDTEPTAVIDGDLDILVNKTDTIDPVEIGSTTEYVITVTNTVIDSNPSRSSTDEMVVVTDMLPTSLLSYQSHTVSGDGTCSTVPAVGSFGQNLVCSFPFINPGDTEEVRITVLAEAKGNILNNVEIDSRGITAGFDRIAPNNLTSERTTIRTTTDIEMVSKTPDAPIVGGRPVVSLEEDFNWEIVLRVNSGAGLFEADDVEVTDSLPANMRMVGAPTVSSSPAAAFSQAICTGGNGDTSFTCELGTVNAGADVTITVPVEVTSVATYPQTFNNTASVTTSSRDVDPDDNSATGTVDVTSSTIAGQVFRDFDDNAQFEGANTGVGNVLMTLNGVSDDGATITETVRTAADGTYSFRFLPSGTYSVTRGDPGEPYLENGTTTSDGPVPGTVASDTLINAIVLPDDTDSPEHDFPLVPQARVAIAKDVDGSPTILADGSFTVDFALVVENLSLEDFDDVDVTDQLSGGAPLFGSLVTLGAPLTDPMAFGTYTVISAPSGDCGGFNAGFDGSGDTVAASNFTLGSGDDCTIRFSLRVMPTDPIPALLPSGGRYENQAVVEARGALSGQTSATNPQMTDLSDDGASPDGDSDGMGNEAGENDPTPVAPAYNPSIDLVKGVDRSALSDPVVENDVLTYTFEVHNTGNVTLTNIMIEDPLPGLVLSGGPITLTPGGIDLLTFTGRLELTQDQVDAGTVVNQATVTGTDPFGDPVTDLSGVVVGDDSPTVTPLVEEPGIVLIKMADASAFQSPTLPMDEISYTFTVINSGNVTLTNVRLTDVLPGIVISGDPIPVMLPGATDTDTFTATYRISQDDIVAGFVENSATITGTPPSGPDVTDLSGTDASSDDPTVVPIVQSPAIDLVKTVDTVPLLDGAAVGEEITYSFVVTNTGNMPLTGIVIADDLVGINLTGGPISLLPGEFDDDSFSATYEIRQEDIDAGEVINLATVTGTWGPNPGEVVTDEDSVTAGVGTIEAIPEVFPPFTTDGGTTTCILASDLLNDDPATLDNVTIRVIRADEGVTLDPDTCLITLAPGFPAGEYQVEYEIASIDIPTLTDTTIETVVQGPRPAIEVVKTQVFTDNGDGRDDVGDLVTYTIDATNVGNMGLSDVVLVDTLTDLNGAALTLDSGPTFVSATEGSSVGALEIGETATYTATFTIDLQAVNAGGVENTVTATATAIYLPGIPEGPTSVDDISDDGIDSDGNMADDPTQLVLSASVPSDGLTLNKVTSSNIVLRGAVVPYTITLANENDFVAATFDMVDRLPDGFIYVPGSATLDGAPFDVSVDGGRVTWEDIAVPAQGEVVATLSARILNGTRAGEHTNTVRVFDADSGDLVVGPARATVRILPEAVFDCGEVVGRVFNDLDGDGYQDAPGGTEVPLLPSGITDQSYDGGKAGPVVEKPGVEHGIPGARLATVDGLIITTDENGLFSVPCAMLPDGAGSNFILKLDDRSLPTGYRLTTENPRVMRLTPGMLTEMNFGATLGQVARVDLNGSAFYATADGVAMQPALISGIETLLNQIGADPVTVRLGFHVPADAGSDVVGQARDLMDIVQAHIDQRWDAIGGRPLRVEQIIIRAKH